MTSFVNFVTSNFTSSSSFGALTDGIAVIVVLILLTLLIEKVLLEAYEGKPNDNKTQGFTIVILPFLFVMAVVVFLRVAQILHL